MSEDVAARSRTGWRKLSAAVPDSLASSLTAVDDIYAHRIDGVVVSSVFTAEECAAAVDVLDRDRREHGAIDALFGPMLGIPLAEVSARAGDPHERDLYLRDAEARLRVLREAFGADPHDRVAAVLASLAGGRTIATPVDGDRPYASGNVRWMVEGRGGLPSHVDREFASYHDGTLDHLSEQANVEGHLSWFVILQEPTTGGALSVYDPRYEGYRPNQAGWTDTGRDDADFEGFEAEQIRPSVGSLVMFGGGWRWHRVDPVGPGAARVTYGGFAADAHDARTLFTWF